MIADADLLKTLGADWTKKRKQAPTTWLRQLAAESGCSMKIKGRVAFVDRPGKHGEAARRIEEKFLSLHNETRDLQEPVDAEDEVQTLGALIDDENKALAAMGLEVLARHRIKDG
jgi:hypothetical protein